MEETKISQCINIIKFNPHPSTPQIQAIAAEIKCDERTVYRAMKAVELANASSTSNSTTSTSTPPEKKKGPGGSSKSYNPGKAVTPPTFKPTSAVKIPQLRKNMSFEHFCKYYAYPYYNGLYRWQYQWYKAVWPFKYSLTLVARDHGKSIGHGDLCQYLMGVKNYDVLYLGWTNRRREIAEYVYNFFLQRNELVIDKASSPYHFKTIYGTRFDTYSVKSKEILGKHEMGMLEREIIEENEYLIEFVRNEERPLLMVIDDAIDDTFKDERHKEVKLEQFFKSTILNINPDKMMTVGTHKFKGDFYHFIENTFKNEILVFKRGPFLTPEDPRYGKEPDNPANLLCPERWISKEHPSYLKYLELLEQIKTLKDITTLAPFEQDLIKKKDLTKRREQIGEYWYGAEYEQEPNPVTGEVWDKLNYKLGWGKLADYKLIIISIDRATTVKTTSDFTGITIFFRDKYNNILVTNDMTQKIPLSELLPLMEDTWNELAHEYGSYMLMFMVVEKQGGGDDFIELAKAGDYNFGGNIIPVHNTRNKEQRIMDTLEKPIKNGIVSFLQSLKDSELIAEINTFPHPDKIDALDSLANGVIEANKMPEVDRASEEKQELLKMYRENQQDAQTQSSSIRELINTHSKYGKRRSVF